MSGGRRSPGPWGGALGRALLLVLVPWLPLRAQALILETGIHGTMTIVDSGRVGVIAGPRLAFRTFGGTRVAASVGAGFRGDSASARGEAALEFVMSPRLARRFSVYVGGGVAGVVGGGRGGYLLLYAGVEGKPGMPKGWAFEAGLGSGFRFRVAYHWRKFPPEWRPQE